VQPETTRVSDVFIPTSSDTMVHSPDVTILIWLVFHGTFALMMVHAEVTWIKHIYLLSSGKF
jgi:hypothetical protein